MIVNPSYIFMGRKPPIADPNLWSNGVVNVPYTGSASSFSSERNAFDLYAGGHIDFTVPAYGYSKLKFVAENISHAINAKRYNVSVLVGGTEIGTTTLEALSKEGQGWPGTFNIPEAYRENGIVIRVNSPKTPTYTIRLISATLE